MLTFSVSFVIAAIFAVVNCGHRGISSFSRLDADTKTDPKSQRQVLKKSYSGYSIFTVTPQNESEVWKLEELAKQLTSRHDVEFFPYPDKNAVGRAISILTPPWLKAKVLNRLEREVGLRTTKAVEDLATVLDLAATDEYAPRPKQTQRKPQTRGRRRRHVEGIEEITQHEAIISSTTKEIPTTASTTTKAPTTKTPTTEATTTEATTTQAATTETTDTKAPTTETTDTKAPTIETITSGATISGSNTSGANTTETPTPEPTIVGRWARLEEIYEWLDSMVAKHPFKASMFFAGRSEEGRLLRGIKIGRGNSKSPVIWIHAGIHAREWIAPATAVYVVDRLLTAQDKRVQDILDNAVFYILPVANPDGYVYSMDCDRLWRKNLKGGSSKYCCTSGYYCYSCFGVDLNRNWNVAFKSIGASSWPCDQTFAGDFAFSEAETRSIAYTIQTMSPRVKAFLTFHSYGQVWAMPWVHSPNPPEDYDDLIQMSKEATASIRAVHGSEWTYGPGYFSVYPIGGCSMDWAKRGGVKYSYTLELRPHSRDHDGAYPLGFIRPSTDIIPSGEEVWPAVLLVAEKVIVDADTEQKAKAKAAAAAAAAAAVDNAAEAEDEELVEEEDE